MRAMEEKDWNDDSLTMTIVSHHCFDNDSEAPSFSISIIEHNHRFSGANVVEVLELPCLAWLQQNSVPVSLLPMTSLD
ncbi:hypothetical protein glysoja_024406 [Glycine soja]|uniref:Uncharacterized protein n=1 Tax=Glycine soja TaxID=3848 RepID=A0A0B2SIJ1_GLYSO|nr:hypothetical protein glysoja_024406 [Glycine soja]